MGSGKCPAVANLIRFRVWRRVLNELLQDLRGGMTEILMLQV
jgi:hypothetical protein